MSNFYSVHLLLFLLPFLISTPTPKTSPKLGKGGFVGSSAKRSHHTDSGTAGGSGGHCLGSDPVVVAMGRSRGGYRGLAEGGQTCLSPFSSPAPPLWVKTRLTSPNCFSLPCGHPKGKRRTVRRALLWAQLLTVHFRRLSLGLRHAEKRICSKVQGVIKTQPLSSQCPGWRPPR